MDLSAIRTEIDTIDEELVSLLLKRMDCSLRVAEIKKRAGLAIYHPTREQEILDRVRAAGGDKGTYLVEIYRLLMECSRELQHQSLQHDVSLRRLVETAEPALSMRGRLACYGQEGAFTHLALTSVFRAEPTKTHFCNTFEQVFAAVDEETADFGFVPVENSSAGSVGEVYDLILKYKLFIVASAVMPIEHNLLAPHEATLDDIKVVYSHPQALSQCKAFLEANGIEARPFGNTASAAAKVAALQDKSVAALGSLKCAEETGLSVLLPSVQSFANNKTRFIALSKRPILPLQNDKISLVFSLSHTAGSLQKILTRFSLHGLNLTKLESRAGKNGDFETQFYLDFLGNVREEKTLLLLSSLQSELEDFSFLGNYPEMKGENIK